ncbi:hypothetical protein OPV22_024881 [Ensete ventricosum]|uniref:Late embryogenesis abundant protein LEA-2 subgroup domain-containing protein n=1 Tax=Ensete ventricosum TaxID=4639 RepID=A0A426Z691_ENSVE|nr:hypothetical protein OPV22_024881 [Ensete ventricosum]RRT59508.1 hypothetical protein B296_00045756 [Ensete ventricosum]RWW74159.1 hypothetical protein BHE74_00017917 [Ensete ventricosum]RZR97062.1 hypothetical protein BHM03_00026186 [Ensete ventricosum]
MPGFVRATPRHTSWVVWLAAIVCAVLAIAVIITGIVVFAIYIIYQPKMPYIKVAYAQLNNLVYDQSGLLEIEMVLRLVAENDNKKAHASFSDLSFLLQFHRINVAELRADPFDVAKNSSLELDYLFQSSSIPLDQAAMENMDVALKKGIVSFDLSGHARTRWRVGIFLSVKFRTDLSCELRFFRQNGSAVNLNCNSKSD